jgi:hypothetical protein
MIDLKTLENWTLNDFSPPDGGIHYEIFTKREIRIRGVKDD